MKYVIGNSLDVDCEYNRNIEDLRNSKKICILESKIKKVIKLKEESQNISNIIDDKYREISVIPDIIVHTRGKDSNNTLAIEVKKSKSKVSQDYDLEKLKCYTDTTYDINDLKYEYGAFIMFYTGESQVKYPKITWFQNGKQINEQ
ncbi:hypothetical protein EQM13_10265 [Acidilutibacter cellobiosedens]|uniref:Uncharacterized protein n=1 Tax=Acidilutibacter cellobiosedens TaxID=2507161 RepID=A0A410QD84_9FIRM|nr:hypothetical protein [Acidilutibacter cellobiosedens]QAT61950.1 hypothetical protein EQM13_10265 [Acidilutibacter cellobiosedens]